MTDDGTGSPDGAEDGQALHRVGQARVGAALEIGRSRVDAATQRHPLAARLEVADLAVLVPGGQGVGGGEDAELAIGCLAEVRMHPCTLRVEAS
jgi:hypothetical protein